MSPDQMECSIHALASETDLTRFSILRDQLHQFVCGHGERRIRQQSLDWLKAYEQDSSGSVLYARILERDLPSNPVVGVTAECHDRSIGFTVIAPSFRRCGIGSRLLSAKLAIDSRYETLVATDNHTCLAWLFGHGFVATALVDNGNGKQVLRMRIRP